MTPVNPNKGRITQTGIATESCENHFSSLEKKGGKSFKTGGKKPCAVPIQPHRRPCSDSLRRSTLISHCICPRMTSSTARRGHPAHCPHHNQAVKVAAHPLMNGRRTCRPVNLFCCLPAHASGAAAIRQPQEGIASSLIIHAQWRSTLLTKK